MKLEKVTINEKMDLSKHTFNIDSETVATKRIKFKFVNVDTEELKDTVITCNGELA